MLLQLHQTSPSTEVGIRDQDSGDAGGIGFQTTQLQGCIRSCVGENYFCDRFHQHNDGVTWTQRAGNDGLTTLDDGKTADNVTYTGRIIVYLGGTVKAKQEGG
jgi:hypothetical protein